MGRKGVLRLFMKLKIILDGYESLDDIKENDFVFIHDCRFEETGKISWEEKTIGLCLMYAGGDRIIIPLSKGHYCSLSTDERFFDIGRSLLSYYGECSSYDIWAIKNGNFFADTEKDFLRIKFLDNVHDLNF